MKGHLPSLAATLTAILAASLYWNPGNSAAGGFDGVPIEAVLPRSQEPTAMDGSRSDALRAAVIDRIPLAGRAAVVFVRDADLYTCNDLGRELRRLARWAASDSIPLLIATDGSGAARLSTYLSREKVPTQVVIVADDRILRDASRATPSLLLISAAGAAQGFTRRDERSSIDFVSWAGAIHEPSLVESP